MALVDKLRSSKAKHTLRATQHKNVQNSPIISEAIFARPKSFYFAISYIKNLSILQIKNWLHLQIAYSSPTLNFHQHLGFLTSF